MAPARLLRVAIRKSGLPPPAPELEYHLQEGTILPKNEGERWTSIAVFEDKKTAMQFFFNEFVATSDLPNPETAEALLETFETMATEDLPTADLPGEPTDPGLG